MKHTLWLLLAVVLPAAGGGAPAYHAYPCGCVPYGYCPEPPLPYTRYCGCPTPWAAKLRGEHPTAPAESAGDGRRGSLMRPRPEGQEPNRNLTSQDVRYPTQ
jgi:hypothetical protein